jgi:histidinol-phosphatase
MAVGLGNVKGNPAESRETGSRAGGLTGGRGSRRVRGLMSKPSLSELLSVAMEAAYLGGKRTLAYFNAGVAVETKADDTPVTCADRESEAVIRAYVARHYPAHGIIGEEGGSTAGDPEYRWIIDPIDGTKTFVRGVPLYGVLIGVEVRGEPSVGVIYMPALDEMVSAADGLGCRWNGRPCQVSDVSELRDGAVMCSDARMAMARSDVYERISSQTKFQRTWADCYGYALVATGRAEVMMDPAMNPWDCAPMLPILREAGGHFTDWSGKETIWGKDAVATNGKLHGKVMEIFREEKRRDAK